MGTDCFADGTPVTGYDRFAKVRPPKVFDESGRYPKPGPGLCRWCHEPFAKPRRVYCSDACGLSRFVWNSWGDTAAYVFYRDGGICQLCGIDCRLVERIARRLEELGKLDARPMPLGVEAAGARAAWRSWRDGPALVFFLRAVAWKKHPDSYSECDHVLPRARGGHNQPPNLRTLCQPCHREVTSDFASLRAAGRKTTPQLTLVEPSSILKKHPGHWPKGRKIQSRGFPKVHRPLRRR